MRRLAPLLLLLAFAAPARAQEITPPMDLPGTGASAAGAEDWLIGVRPGTPTPAGARRLQPGTLVVPRARARATAARLRRAGDLVYAEPDRVKQRLSAADTNPAGWARGAVVNPGTPWPGSNPVGVIDSFVDPQTPDLTGQVTYLNATAASTIDDAHGTEVASAIAAQRQGSGVMGVLPGAPIASWGVSNEITCSEVVEGVNAMVRAGVKVVNISLGGPGVCYSEYLADQRAYGTGTLLVASAGNDYQEGNPVLYPAAFPHVVSVTAVNPDLTSADFSSENAAVDIAAPGVGVPLALPRGFDTDDGSQDGFTLADGTSFSSPMVAGAAAWIRANDPELSAGQVADTLRFSAADLGDSGYDNRYGWGLLNVDAALVEPTPAHDPLEPNDDIAFVSGRVFNRPDKPVWTGNGRRSLSASTDQWEDPLDVYRYKLRPRSEVRITLSNDFGDADLAIFDKPARNTRQRRHRVCTSRFSGDRTDFCDIFWNGGRSRIGYVAVNSASLNAGYTLRFRRTD